MILPVSTWIWARWMVPDAASSLRRPWVHVGLGGALLIPLFLGHETRERSGEIGKLGIEGIRANATYLSEKLANEWLLGIAGALLVLTVVGLVRRAVIGRGRFVIHQQASLPRGSMWHFSMVMGVLACLWIAPFLLNADYAKPYYVTLMTAPLAAIAARLLCSAAIAVRTMWLSVAIAVPLLFPYQQVAAEWEFMPEDELTGALVEVKRLAEGYSPPRRIAVAAICRSTADTAASTKRLAEIYSRSERGSAFRWATGWYDADVEILHYGDTEALTSADDVFLIAYCIGERVRHTSPGPSGAR